MVYNVGVDPLTWSADVSSDEWLRFVDSPQPGEPPFLVVCFPNESVRDECLASARLWPEERVTQVLRCFLGESRDIRDHDELLLRSLAEAHRHDGGHSMREWDRRAIARYLGGSTVPVWEGLTWILDLLPAFPQEALQAVSGYILAHAQELPDLRHVGLADAKGLIRSRYLELDVADEASLVGLLLTLPPRDFEFFVAAIWQAQGYDVTVTPQVKDRGKDVIATRSGVGAEVVFIECKNWRGAVNAVEVRALRGAVTKADVNRGVLVGTSGFTTGDASATAESVDDHRITLIDGRELVGLAQAHLGPHWAIRLDRIIEEMRHAARA